MAESGIKGSALRATFAAVILAVGAVLVAGPAGAQSTPMGDDAVEQTVIFLVRHGETAPDGTRNPPLSAEGTARADRLAEMLVDAGIDGVYSTDYLRTRGTAGPVAARLGLDAVLYDPRDLAGFAATLRARPGRFLVVGHSNTTPALVEALGGAPGSPIDESEHDRLYVVILGDGPVQTALLRY